MWFIFGLVLGVGVVCMAMWLRDQRIMVRWYEYFIGGLGLVLLIWTMHDFFASLAEHNEIAALTFLWLLGVPGLILLVVSFLLPWRRHRQTIQ
jgi:bacteriorhodopsin